MATLSKGQVFGVTETITNTKLHNLIDLGSVSSIVNADIDNNAEIADTKLATIGTAGKVNGTALSNLASISSGAGIIPQENLPDSISDLDNLVVSSIASISRLDVENLVPANASIPGNQIYNLASFPTAEVFNYNNVVSSLASGSFPMYNGSNNLIGEALDVNAWKRISRTTVSTSTNSGDITIEQGKLYKVIAEIENTEVTGDTIGLRFNSDSGSHYGNNGEALTVSAQINLSDTLGSLSSGGNALIQFIMTTIITDRMVVTGQSSGRGVAGVQGMDIIGMWDDSDTVVNFEILSSGGTPREFNGTITLYEQVV